MIVLISGSPGSGKSLFVVSDLILDYLKDGRSVYTNIKGLQYFKEEVIYGQTIRKNIVKTKDNVPVWELVHILPDDFDWRDLPNGSVVIYDEAQQFFPASGRSGLSSDGRITDLDTHRHRGFDILFITQHPTLIDSHIRKFVGLHYHLYRKWGGSYSNQYLWNHCNSSPELEIGEMQRSDRRFFRFPKKAFSFYKSSEIHTVKFRFPRKFIYLILGFILLFLIVGLLAYKSFSNISSVYKSGQVGSGTSFSSITSRPDSALSCSVVGDSCSCVDNSNNVVDTSLGYCVSKSINSLNIR